MATQAEKVVRIEHADGRRAAVTQHDFAHKKMAALRGQTYQDAGYSIIGYEDGTPFEDGSEPTKYAVNAAAASPEIGADTNTGHTNIDGGKLTDAQRTDLGISEPATPTRARKSDATPTAATSAETPTPPAQS